MREDERERDDVREYDWVPDAQFTNPVTASYEVLAAGIRKVDGVLLDAQTARAITIVWEGLGPASRAKMESLHIVRAAEIAWKLVR